MAEGERLPRVDYIAFCRGLGPRLMVPLPDRLSLNVLRAHIAAHNHAYLAVLPFKYLPLLACGIYLRGRGRRLNLPLSLAYIKLASICFFYPMAYVLHGRSGTIDLAAILGGKLAHDRSLAQRGQLVASVLAAQKWAERRGRGPAAAWGRFKRLSAHYPRPSDYKALVFSSQLKKKYIDHPFLLQGRFVLNTATGNVGAAAKLLRNVLFDDSFDIAAFALCVIGLRFIRPHVRRLIAAETSARRLASRPAPPRSL